LKAITTAAWALGLLAAASAPAQEPQPAVCFVAKYAPWINRRIDAQYAEKLHSAGYAVGLLEYAELSAEAIKPFNVLVLSWVPGPGDSQFLELFRPKVPVLLDYARSGGGLLITMEENYDSHRVVNQLLAELDAEVLPETVVDQDTLERQSRYLQYYFCHTSNFGDHPVAAGLSRVTYPLGHSQESVRDTMPLKLGPAWTPVVKGDRSARSSGGSVPAEPVWVAAREVGAGRVVVFASHATYWHHDGFHRVWEQRCLGQNDGSKLLDNIYRWLAEPSVRSGSFGGYQEPAREEPPGPAAPAEKADPAGEADVYTQLARAGIRAPVTLRAYEPDKRQTFAGVIGVYTSLSKGRAGVAEYGAEARRLGLDFLVFTDLLDMMDQAKFEQLVKACRQASDDTFLAIPGLEYDTTEHDRYIIFNIDRWPDAEWLSQDGRRVASTPGIYFGYDWPPLYLVRPWANRNHPHLCKFYSGLELEGRFRGHRLLGSARHEYLRCQANDFNLIPIACHRIVAPQDLHRISGLRCYASAKTLADVPDAYKYHWYAARHAFVSSGPTIEEYSIENGRGAAREEPWRLNARLSSQSPLKQVTIYDRHDVFRRYLPADRTFALALVGYHDRQRHLTLIAEDEAGSVAISPTLYTSDLRQSTYMCTDLQNTLNGMQYVNEKGKLAFQGVMGNYVTGWNGLRPGILADESAIMPEGLDYVVKGFSGNATPLVRAVAGDYYGPAELDMVFNSGDVNVLDHLTGYQCWNSALVPGTQSRTRMISFTPRPNGWNLMLVQNELNVLRDVDLRDHAQGPELQWIDVSGPRDSFPAYCYLRQDGQKVLVAQRDPGEPDQVYVDGQVLHPGCYAAIFPDFYGAAAVFALDRPLDLRIAPGPFETVGITLGEEMPGKRLAAGAELAAGFLLVRGKFGENDEAGFDRIRDLYGLDGTPAYRVNVIRGTLDGTQYLVRLAADDHWAECEVSRADLPNELPVSVRGLNPHWDAGALDLGTGRLRRLGVFEETGFLTLNVNKSDRHVRIGNLLTCDQPELRLSLLQTDGGWHVEAHNPTGNRLETTIEVPPWLEPAVPPASLPWRLEPGETRRASLPDPGSRPGETAHVTTEVLLSPRP